MEYDVVEFAQEAPRFNSNARIYYSPAVHITLMSQLGVEVRITLNEGLRETDKREMENIFWNAHKNRTPIKIAFGIVGEELNKMVESPKIESDEQGN